MPPQKRSFFTFCKTQVHKKTRSVTTPCFFEKLVFLNLHFLKKNTDVEQKQNLKSGKKAKIRKGDLKEKRREETNKNEKGLMNKHFVIEYFVVLFLKQKQRRNQKKERDKSKKTNESKKERQEGRKKEKKKRERQRKKK